MGIAVLAGRNLSGLYVPLNFQFRRIHTQSSKAGDNLAIQDPPNSQFHSMRESDSRFRRRPAHHFFGQDHILKSGGPRPAAPRTIANGRLQPQPEFLVKFY